MTLVRWAVCGALTGSLFLGAGCDPDDPTDAGTDAGGDAGADGAVIDDAGQGPLVVPPTYAFESRFEAGASSVNHGGQTARQVLMLDLTDYAAGLTDAVDANAGTFSDGVDDGEVLGALEYYFSAPPGDRAADPIRLTTSPPSAQMTYGDLSSSADLISKLAGNDTSTDHRDWSAEFAGWSDASFASAGGGVDTPTNLVRAIFHQLEDNAQQRATDPSARQSPVTAPDDLPVHVTESGIDLAELLRTFLSGALAFSQASDDYLDDDLDNKGLRADNTAADDGENFTALEHAWDEGFGYFGASGTYPVATIAGGELVDNHMEDAQVDLRSEYSFGISVEAARRDAESAAAARTLYAQQAWLAFRSGRAVISHANGALTDEEVAALAGHRDSAIAAWELAGVATVVHHLNAVLRIAAEYGTAAFDHARFLALAKRWAQLKGWALMFQFNPRSVLTDVDFGRLHTLIGDAPLLPAAGGAAVTQYQLDLRAARNILGTAYELAPENLGDEDGAGGW